MGITQYDWDFGDGKTGSGKTTNHTYNSPKTYTVRLSVKDAAGNIAIDTITITVTSPEIFPKWIIGGAVVTVGIAITVVLCWKKRQ